MQVTLGALGLERGGGGGGGVGVLRDLIQPRSCTQLELVASLLIHHTNAKLYETQILQELKSRINFWFSYDVLKIQKYKLYIPQSCF